MHFGDDNALGQLIDIEDYRDISEEEIEECGLEEEEDDRARYALINIIEKRNGFTKPSLNPIKYDMVPKDLNEAIPTNKLKYVPVEEAILLHFYF